MSTSATGGYLAPEATPVVEEGDALLDFFQAWFVGVTGIAGQYVRPWPQKKPAPTPDHDTSWMGFTITDQHPDDAPSETQTDDGTSISARHERLEILCVFYGPNASANASRLSHGAYVAQNREPLFLAGIGLFDVGSPKRAQEEVNEEYVDRIDMTISFNREIRREYPVQHLLSASGTTKAQRAEETPSTTTWATPEGD